MRLPWKLRRACPFAGVRLYVFGCFIGVSKFYEKLFQSFKVFLKIVLSIFVNKTLVPHLRIVFEKNILHKFFFSFELVIVIRPCFCL